MTDAQLIELERQSNPYCLCGAIWRSAMTGIGVLRMCPTCPHPVSYCVCNLDAVT